MNNQISLDTWPAEEEVEGSENPLRWRMCECKRRYDRRGARSEINRFANVRGRHGRPEALRAYSCPFCGGWHLTKDFGRQHRYDWAVPTKPTWRTWA